MAEPERVNLIANHPWAGHSGEVIERDGGTVRVRLDNGMEVMAWQPDWKGQGGTLAKTPHPDPVHDGTHFYGDGCPEHPAEDWPESGGR